MTVSGTLMQVFAGDYTLTDGYQIGKWKEEG